MNPVEEAILRTVIYADVFDFPMTAREITHFLIADTPYTLPQVEAALDKSIFLREILETAEGKYFCAGRGAILETRRAREQASTKLWSQAIRCGGWFSYLPFVRMVALTGALAMRNAAHDDDDLDYLLITTCDRVWLGRLFAVLLVRLAKLHGVTLCPNYVLSETALEQSPQTLFMAHEIVQMVPLYGRPLYENMREINNWVFDQLPNTEKPFFDLTEARQNPIITIAKRAAELILSGRIGDTLEAWEYRRKFHRFAPGLKKPHTTAQLDHDHVKGHFDDHAHPILRNYEERLRRYALTEKPLPLAGD